MIHDDVRLHICVNDAKMRLEHMQSYDWGWFDKIGPCEIFLLEKVQNIVVFLTNHRIPICNGVTAEYWQKYSS